MEKAKGNPKISVITPSYNQGEFIKETIDSVLSQNYPNLEYWVIDGGSKDNTVAILKSYGNKIKWVSEKDRGQTHAINKGLRRATGSILTYLNSDDVYLPNTLNTVAEFFSNNPAAMWLTGDYFIIDATGKKIQSFIANYKKLLRQKPTLTRLAVANYIIQPSTFWRRELFKKIGFFDESLRYCMDFDYWMRTIKKYPPAILPNHFSLFRVHKGSKGGGSYDKQFSEEHKIVKKYVKNPLLVFAHKIHMTVTVLIYKLIK
jgi:glycosyltransferase involved in cell wall biosynthesis